MTDLLVRVLRVIFGLLAVVGLAVAYVGGAVQGSTGLTLLGLFIAMIGVMAVVWLTD